MSFAFDPEFAAALAPMAEAMAETTPPPVGDVQTRRETFEAIIASAGAEQPTPPDVTTTDFRAVSSDGAAVPLRWYAKEGSSPSSPRASWWQLGSPPGDAQRHVPGRGAYQQ
jgi:hypothetical protein